MNGDLTYNDFLATIAHTRRARRFAGYHLNKRDGLRYPSYVRTDSDGRRVHGDKFLVTPNGQCYFQPPRQKLYNVISFIKEHPEKFDEYRAGMSTGQIGKLGMQPLVEQSSARRTTTRYWHQKLQVSHSH